MKRLLPLLLGSLIVVWGCQSGGDDAAKGDDAPPTAGSAVAFAQASAVFKENCISCHGGGPGAPADDVDLTKTDWISRYVKPGDPAGSKVIELMKGTKGKTMPPNKPLSADKVKIVEDWIQAGAKT
jgi:mono/diheme cytochrome c family protein